MTAHHLINEDQALHRCMYCGAGLEAFKWKSRFHARKHYKEHKCSCGRYARVTVDINSSGHDTWIQERFRSLEDKVK